MKIPTKNKIQNLFENLLIDKDEKQIMNLIISEQNTEKIIKLLIGVDKK